MWSDLFDFGLAVKEHWEPLVPGGVLLVVELWELYAMRPEGGARKGKVKPPIPHAALRWGIAACVFVSCFLAWRDEHGKVAKFSAAHPHFAERDSAMHFSEMDVKELKDPRFYSAEIKLTNTGAHSAKNLTYLTLFIPQSLDD